MELPIPNEILQHISKQIALINSPQVQEQIKFINSPEYQEAMRFWTSAETQAVIRHWNSSTVQNMIRAASALRTQAKAKPDTSLPVEEHTLSSLRVAAPLVPEESREKFAEITAAEPGNGRKILTAENIRWLLGIIIPILFSLFIHYLPDANAEEGLRLQRENNELQRESNELQRESNESDKRIIELLEDILDAFNGHRDISDDIEEKFEFSNHEPDTPDDVVVQVEQETDVPIDSINPVEQEDNQTEQNDG